MSGTHEEIRDIITAAENENEARINMYKWGIDRGYGIESADPSKERFLTNVLEQPIEDIYKNPAILWHRDKCKDDYQYRREIPEDQLGGARESQEVLSYDQWCKRFAFGQGKCFYDVCAYVSSILGSGVFNVYLQNAKLKDHPHFEIVKNPGFITQHVDQFIEENEHQISEGEKFIFRAMKELCRNAGIAFPPFPVDDIMNELWTPIERDDLCVCGWLCINKATKKCYIIKIS